MEYSFSFAAWYMRLPKIEVTVFFTYFIFLVLSSPFFRVAKQDRQYSDLGCARQQQGFFFPFDPFTINGFWVVVFMVHQDMIPFCSWYKSISNSLYFLDLTSLDSVTPIHF